ncbi:hypothetical protein IAR55_001876 [Kwoniella newhampshirensis]|uniref:Transcription regulator n=1 Tax=Kwoniella newhampshirensis TaxID=1651941 RepID=A0AAW0Z3G7_9TREE
MTALVEHRAFLTKILDRQASRRKSVDPHKVFAPAPSLAGQSRPPLTSTSSASELIDSASASEAGPSRLAAAGSSNVRVGDDKGASKDNVVNYVEEEETIRNDYSGWYGVTGEFGSNFVMGAEDEEICEEYPALKKLITLKSQLVETTSLPPLYLHLSSSSPTTIISSLSPTRFDVILINPFAAFPSSSPTGMWESTAFLPIRQLSSDPGFVFLWVGKGADEGLERGRECFAKWGFRRAEDIVWIKTNKHKRTANDGGGGGAGAGLFASQKEHCLMGIRGTVRRSTDMRFVHCNVDTDVLLWEEDEAGNTPDRPSFPPYLYTLIENFCLGTRRLELFGGSPSLARRGWVTAGLDPLPSGTSQTAVSASRALPFDATTYPSQVTESDGRPILPYHPEIDTLRPKSPQRRSRNLPGGPSGGMPSGRPSPIHTPNFRPSPQFGQTQSFSSQGGGSRMGSHTHQRQPQQTYLQQQQQMQQQMLHQQQQQQAMYAQMMAIGGGMPMGMGMMNPMGMGMGMGMSTGLPFGGGVGPQGFMAPLAGQGGVNGGQPGNWQVGQMDFPDMSMGGYDGMMGGQQQQMGQGQGFGPGSGQGGGMGWQGGWQ